MSPSRRNQLLYSLYISDFYWEQSLWSILPGRIVVLKVLVKHFFCVCDSLLALTFIISSADRLLVQVDDSELSKLILIQAAVIITQYEHKHTAAAGGYGDMPLASSTGDKEEQSGLLLIVCTCVTIPRKTWICIW